MDRLWTLKDYATERRVKVPDEDKEYTVRFSNMRAMLNAARELVDLYEQWERQHFSYHEVDEDAFLFDAQTGKLTFRDTKKIVGKGLELTGEQRVGFYIAPELILGKITSATPETDNWTLAMLLFSLFYHGGHPLSGADSFRQIFLTPQAEYLWYAQNGIFTKEDNSCKNRPVHGIQGHLIRYWDYYPQILQDAFTQVFLDGKDDPEKRLSPAEWKRVLNEMRSQMPCGCGYGGFIDTYRKAGNGNYCCPRCGKIFYALTCKNRHMYISNGTDLYTCQLNPDAVDDMSVAARVVENKQRKGVFGVKNLSDAVWKVTFPDQTEREVPKNQGAPIWSGLKIRLPNEDEWQIESES